MTEKKFTSIKCYGPKRYRSLHCWHIHSRLLTNIIFKYHAWNDKKMPTPYKWDLTCMCVHRLKIRERCQVKAYPSYITMSIQISLNVIPPLGYIFEFGGVIKTIQYQVMFILTFGYFERKLCAITSVCSKDRMRQFDLIWKTLYTIAK